jgi:uncharacterized RDD family membrane protein YckC
VLPSSARACNFCDSPLSAAFSPDEREETIASPSRGNTPISASYSGAQLHASSDTDRDSAWRGELEQRLDAYRVRHGRVAPQRPPSQSQLPFGQTAAEDSSSRHAVSVAEPAPPADATDDFSFTIAIGRYAPPSEKRDGRMMIDVSIPPGSDASAESDAEEEPRVKRYGLYPVASLEDRRWSAFIDVICLLFAYGGFLTLFGSLGGQFTLSKLSAEVYAATLAIVYVQYFALFTVFGGTTPGMMFRGLQVASFSGAPPTPRQMFLRSLGYIVSAGAFLMGFIWSWWDEDALTWHDRISHTYLTSPETRAHLNAPTAAHSR